MSILIISVWTQEARQALQAEAVAGMSPYCSRLVGMLDDSHAPQPQVCCLQRHALRWTVFMSGSDETSWPASCVTHTIRGINLSPSSTMSTCMLYVCRRSKVSSRALLLTSTQGSFRSNAQALVSVSAASDQSCRNS